MFMRSSLQGETKFRHGEQLQLEQRVASSSAAMRFGLITPQRSQRCRRIHSPSGFTHTRWAASAPCRAIGDRREI
jgi:hypothetical protein